MSKLEKFFAKGHPQVVVDHLKNVKNWKTAVLAFKHRNVFVRSEAQARSGASPTLHQLQY
ncbi:MAG TPA: hypothetical protein VGQ00_03345 [Candidatus Norongarragalinales archaeon]|jgi:hypothetical protein|nr:hypothetical protein [Candidatus Norongarragalinales archaeon]